MNIIVNDTANARHSARLRPVEHRSSQISAGPQYVADVLGRFGAESADAADAGDAAPAVLGYN